MSGKTLLSCLAIALIASLSPSAHSGEVPPGAAVDLGGAAASPWLEQLGNEPTVTVDARSIPLLANFPLQTQYYTIDPNVVASGFYYHFTVRAPDRTYLVASFPKLAKLCRELEVIQEIRGMDKGKEFVKGVGEGVESIGTGLGNLIMHPGISLQNFGHRARVTGRSIERKVDEAFDDGDGDSGLASTGVDRSLLGDGPAGGQRRAIAAQLGIDVYTDNPVLRQELTDLSQVKAAGGFATWAIPFHLGLLAGFNTFTGDERAELLIRDYPPYEVRRQVGENLEPIFRMNRESGNPLSALLLNPNYTPREIAYIGIDFQFLAGVAGLDKVLDIMSRAGDPDEADMLAMSLRLYSFLHRRVTPLKKFAPFHDVFAAMSSRDVFYFILTADTVRPWPAITGAFNELIKEAMGLKAQAMEIWCAGDVDATIIRNAASRNVTVRQNVLANPNFVPAPEQPSVK